MLVTATAWALESLSGQFQTRLQESDTDLRILPKGICKVLVSRPAEQTCLLTMVAGAPPSRVL